MNPTPHMAAAGQVSIRRPESASPVTRRRGSSVGPTRLPPGGKHREPRLGEVDLDGPHSASPKPRCDRHHSRRYRGPTFVQWNDPGRAASLDRRCRSTEEPMAALIVRKNPQLHRIERAIAEFKARPAAEQMRKQTLLTALYAERAEIAGSRA